MLLRRKRAIQLEYKVKIKVIAILSNCFLELKRVWMKDFGFYIW